MLVYHPVTRTSAMGIFSKLLGAKSKVVALESPSLGILNLAGDRVSSLIEEDLGAIRGHFGSQKAASSSPPLCDVLFVYADIDASGRIDGTTQSLRELIRDSNAKIAVVATENDGDSYIAAAPDVGFGYANLVMTIERQGTSFPNFFGSLFALMCEGVSMPVAWNQLAPQIPGGEHPNIPETIFACEMGQLSFARA